MRRQCGLHLKGWSPSSGCYILHLILSRGTDTAGRGRAFHRRPRGNSEASDGRTRLRAVLRGVASARPRRERRARRGGRPSASRSSRTTSIPWTTPGREPVRLERARRDRAGDRSLRLGTGVTCPTIRIHPAMIAQAAATTAALMPGRFFLGVGTGENLNEHILGDRWPTTTSGSRCSRRRSRSSASSGRAS